MSANVVNFKHGWTRTFAAAVCDESGALLFSHAFGDPVATLLKTEIQLLKHICESTSSKLMLFTNNQILAATYERLRLGAPILESEAFGDLWQVIRDATHNFQRVAVLHASDHGQTDFGIFLKQKTYNIAVSNAVIPPKTIVAWKQHVAIQQAWLCSLSKLLSTTNADRENTSDGETMVVQLENVSVNVVNRFPRWDWHFAWSDYTWKMNPGQLSLPKNWPHSAQAWHDTVAFVENLSWRIDDAAGCSVYEMSFHFWRQCKFTVPTILAINRGHFISIADWIRHFMRCARKQGVQIHPPNTVFDARKWYWNNQCFGYGTFKGCRFGISSSNLHGLAGFVLTLPNGGVSAADWNRPLSQVL
eukprot:Skav227426  [mRNA]  locus=scaffold1986:178430:179509:- [translate_table: standard]